MMRDPKIETMPRDKLKALQLERLKVKVREVYDKVPFYQLALKEKGITPNDIRTRQLSLRTYGRFPG
jgi:phenylacetate-CoA ligase